MIDKNSSCSAAGIIVFRNKNNNPEILGLIALKKDRKRAGGRYDIPKGQIDQGEEPIQAAKRECWEESGLRPKIVSESYSNGRITVWLGIVDDFKEVKILNNPETGLAEHEGYDWVTTKQMKKLCLGYLKEHICWAEKKAWEYLRI